MEALITRNELAHEYAAFSVKLSDELGLSTENLYEREFREIMQMNELDFILLFHKNTGHVLQYVSRNKYFL
jgi:hypothetical protein